MGVIAYLNWKKGIKLINSNAYLNNVKLTNENDPLEFSIDDVCKLLKNGKVIGLYTGNGEAGPRALGHRSLLANPTIKKMKRIVSIDIKGREWYRPLAPIVLETEMEDLFEDYQRSEIMKYMLYEFKVKDRVKNLIPAVVHIDGTSRAQIVMKNDPDLVLVSEMFQTMSNEYNIPCLINTSFNTAGEPIVHTKEEAISTPKAMRLNGVILDNHYIHLRD